MDEHVWTESGSEYVLEWGGRSWRLRVDASQPGLYAGELGPLLGLRGLAATGRWEPRVLSGSSLTHRACHVNRVEATYVPPNWGETTVRVTWAPRGHDAIDLLVELSTRSVGELNGVEVGVASSLAPAGSESEPGSEPVRSSRWVLPRNAAAAALSYDGREPDRDAIVTLATDDAAFQAPTLLQAGSGWTYVELVHPDDVARRVREGAGSIDACPTVRYGLFGHDLERGVVLRARLRGIWLPTDQAEVEARRRMDEFLREPLPLTT